MADSLGEALRARLSKSSEIVAGVLVFVLASQLLPSGLSLGYRLAWMILSALIAVVLAHWVVSLLNPQITLSIDFELLASKTAPDGRIIDQSPFRIPRPRPNTGVWLRASVESDAPSMFLSERRIRSHLNRVEAIYVDFKPANGLVCNVQFPLGVRAIGLDEQRRGARISLPADHDRGPCGTFGVELAPLFVPTNTKCHVRTRITMVAADGWKDKLRTWASRRRIRIVTGLRTIEWS